MNYARRLDRRAALRTKRRSVVKDQIRRGLMAERLEDRSLMAADLSSFLASGHSDYWNVVKPTDVTNDGHVAPNDALEIINRLNASGSQQLPQGTGGEGETGPRMYVDVNNDGFISPGDALAVINQLNGEGDTVKRVRYTVQTLAPGTDTPISTVQAGQDFDVQIVVDDLKNDGNPNRGVFAAYSDLGYDKSLSKVRVAEVQIVTVGGAGTATLTLGGQTTAPFQVVTTAQGSPPVPARAFNATQIQTALNTTLGANTVFVSPTSTSGAFSYYVWFVGQYDVNQAKLSGAAASGTATVTVRDAADNLPTSVIRAVDGDPTIAASFTEAFRSRDLPNGDLASPYQNFLSAIDASSPDRVDEMGAAAGLAAVGNGPIELLRVRMKAILPSGDSATQTFIPDFTNNLHPAHDTLVYADASTSPPESTAVANDEIDIISATITINSGVIIAQPDTLAFAEDEASAALRTVNVLTNDSKTASAPPGALQVVSFTQPATGGTVARVNAGDLTNGNLVFTPTQDFNGTATFTYTVGIVGDNNVNDQKVQTVTVNISAVNDAPVNTVPGAQNTPEDVVKIINGMSIADVDAGTADVQVTLAATNGTISLSGIAGLAFSSGDGTGDATMTFTGPLTAVNTAIGGLTFTPTADFNGTASLTITTNDQGNTGSGGAKTDTDSVSITVTPVNDAPTNQIGTPPAPITPGNSVLAIPDTTFSFTGANLLSVKDPDAGTSFSTTLALAPNTGTLGITPSGATVTGAGTANISISGSLTAVNAALATLTYSPQAGFTGSSTLTIVSNDGQAQDSDTLGIDVIPPNKPFARNDALAIDEGTTAAQTIAVLANDLTNTGAVPTLESFTQPLSGAPGTVALNDNGTPTDKTDDKLVYTPPGGDFFGTVQFTYVINETPATASNGPSTGTVTVTINNINDAPVGVADNFGTAIGVPLTVPARGVLTNDTDVDDPATSLKAVNAVIAAGQGTVTLNQDGSFTYTPPAGGGNFSFTYQAEDPHGARSAATTVSIHVAAPPQVTNSSATAQEDTTTPISIAANYSDPTENRPLGSVEIVSNVPAAAGTVTVAADNKSFSYAPSNNFNTTRPPVSPITFTYRAKASDGTASNVATVSISVNEVNDNPTAVNDTFLAVKNNGSIGIDQPVTVLTNDSILPDVQETLKVTGVNGTDADVNGNTAAIPTTGGGSVKLVNFEIKYTSPPTTGSDSFTYKVSDFDQTSGAARGGSATATVNVTIVDFVPKTVSGTIFIDGDNDGNIGASEKRLANVEVHLVGTDFTNQAVALTAFTDVNGVYSFVGVKPPAAGTSYTITEVQPAYLTTGLDTNAAASALVTNTSRLDNLFALAWGVTDQSGNITGLNFGERGVNVASLSDSSGLLAEYLASSGSNGFVMAVDLGGNTLWSWSLPGWDNTKTVSATLNSLSSLTLHITDGQNHSYSVDLGTGFTIPGSTARFRILGVGQNGQYIIRIDGSANGATDGMGLPQLLAATPGAGGEGEGSVDPQYAGGADAVFASQAWA
jgi:Bacterial cadherin-like domain/Dockerin type I domain/Bacterial Ig domain/Cadherin-like domain